MPTSVPIPGRAKLVTGIAVFAHGSSIESANQAVRDVTARLSGVAEACFLEGGKPDLRGAVERLVARGAGRVLVVPYFLTLGLHLQRDLPRIVAEVEAAVPGVPIRVTAPLDGHPSLAGILEDRAARGFEAWD
ncbi:MAG: cobalamin biosynthesis protein CbiX [Acidobacteria bacterium]|nr:cobalamin biosynthesis protein CbiX [Acidobacteriota bacterium]